MSTNNKVKELTIKFLKERWSKVRYPKEWEYNFDEANFHKWETRIDGILMGFYWEFKFFDTKSRIAFYKTLRDYKMSKIAKDLANYMRREANKRREYK